MTRDIKQRAAGLGLPPGYRIDYTGDSEEMMESFGHAMQSLALAVVLIYAILASQFRSFLQPFAIMFSLPLSLVGVAGMLYVVRDTLNMMSMIGVNISLVLNDLEHRSNLRNALVEKLKEADPCIEDFSTKVCQQPLSAPGSNLQGALIGSASVHRLAV